MTTLYRMAPELRADVPGRTLFGLAVPYNVVTEIRDRFGGFRETFAPGSFTRSVQERAHKVKLHVQHDVRRLPIGRATELVERGDGLHAAFHIARTRDGDEALELVESGVVDGFSVGFESVRDHRGDDGLITRVEAKLREISLVHSPAYSTALVQGVRAVSDDRLPVDAARRRLRLVLARYPK